MGIIDDHEEWLSCLNPLETARNGSALPYSVGN
jgi:hypothetical protein